MKKKLIILFILITCLFCCPKTSIFSFADTQINNSLQINTLYPNNILDYENLSNVSQTTSNNNYIAYSQNNILTILNKQTRQTITINEFTSISNIKFIKDDTLLLIDSSTEKVFVITISETTHTISSLSDINLEKLFLSDIFVTETHTFIGLIRTVSENKIFEVYKLSNSDFSKKPQIIDDISNTTVLNNAYTMAISDNSLYVLLKTQPEPRILYKSFISDEPSQIKVEHELELINYYRHNNSDYLISFSQGNFCVISPNDLSTTHHTPTNLEVVDIDIFENNIIISETLKNTIRLYNVNQEENEISLKEHSVLISSTHDALGRFNSATDIFIQNNSLFIADTLNDRVQIIDSELNCHKIDDLEIDSQPNNIVIDSFRNIYFATTTTSGNKKTTIINKYSLNDLNIYEKSTTYSTYNTTPIGLVSDMTISNNDDIYIIDHENNNLLLLNNNTGLKNKYSFSFDLDSNTKLEYIKEFNRLVLWNNNYLSLINPINLDSNQNIILDNIEISNCKSITADANAIYLLQDNQIKLVTISNDEFTLSETTLTDNKFLNYSTISYDIANRQMFAFNIEEQCIVYFDCELNQNPFSFNQIKNTELLDNTKIPFAINIKNNAIIYDLPYSLGKQYINVTQCIGIEPFGNYYRVLFEYDNVLNIGFIDKSNTTVIPHDTTQKIRVITTNLQVPIYKYPTILKLENQAIITSYIPINTYITITYHHFPITIDNKIFYTYEIDDKIGYIFNADVVLADSTNITTLQHNNASINAIGEDKIYIYDEDKSTIIGTLNNEDLIYVESYDKKSEFTKITYKNADLNTITGYVKTEYVQMDELDNNRIVLILIIAISILILITILITYFIIKKRK